ncbi:hypothetical protein VPH35_139599 [Triticum aestivum]
MPPGSMKKEEPASPSPPRRAPAPPAFSIAPKAAGERDRHYIEGAVCRRYWETRTPLPWRDVHLPNNWHLSADCVPIPPVPLRGRAHRQEIQRRRRLLPDDLYYDESLMPRVPEDSMHTHDERQWEGLEEMTDLSTAGDVAIPELEMVPKEEVVEEPLVAAFHPGLVGQGW